MTFFEQQEAALTCSGSSTVHVPGGLVYVGVHQRHKTALRRTRDLLERHGCVVGEGRHLNRL